MNFPFFLIFVFRITRNNNHHCVCSYIFQNYLLFLLFCCLCSDALRDLVPFVQFTKIPFEECCFSFTGFHLLKPGIYHRIYGIYNLLKLHDLLGGLITPPRNSPPHRPSPSPIGIGTSPRFQPSPSFGRSNLKG